MKLINFTVLENAKAIYFICKAQKNILNSIAP